MSPIIRAFLPLVLIVVGLIAYAAYSNAHHTD